ncbi:MAG TPA: hypothetical protein VFT61_02470 [Sphingomicrobium sp.]|nr:hypothetical protein [Sphingomicrobium sp.]
MSDDLPPEYPKPNQGEERQKNTDEREKQREHIKPAKHVSRFDALISRTPERETNSPGILQGSQVVGECPAVIKKKNQSETLQRAHYRREIAPSWGIGLGALRLTWLDCHVSPSSEQRGLNHGGGAESIAGFAGSHLVENRVEQSDSIVSCGTKGGISVSPGEVTRKLATQFLAVFFAFLSLDF